MAKGREEDSASKLREGLGFHDLIGRNQLTMTSFWRGSSIPSTIRMQEGSKMANTPSSIFFSLEIYSASVPVLKATRLRCTRPLSRADVRRDAIKRARSRSLHISTTRAVLSNGLGASFEGVRKPHFELGLFGELVDDRTPHSEVHTYFTRISVMSLMKAVDSWYGRKQARSSSWLNS